MTISSGGPARLAIAIPADADGERLDRALARLVPDLSRTRIQALIASGACTRGGAVLSEPSARVKAGEALALDLPAPEPAAPQPQAIALDIVHEDASLIVVNKPPGLVVHPAAGNPDGTLVNALLAHCGDQLSGIGGVARPGIVHRIDKDTSGLLVVAKTERAHRSLGRQFAAHAVERAYLAVVWGGPRDRKGRIEANLARDPHDRQKIAVVHSGGRAAITNWTREAVCVLGGRAAASRLTCRLETGRTHQIRVHMAHLGHPLVGDRTYGKGRSAPKPANEEEAAAAAALDGFPRQALHAGVLGFQHPETHAALRFEVPPPQDLAQLLAALAPLED